MAELEVTTLTRRFRREQDRRVGAELRDRRLLLRPWEAAVIHRRRQPRTLDRSDEHIQCLPKPGEHQYLFASCDVASEEFDEHTHLVRFRDGSSAFGKIAPAEFRQRR